MNAPASAPSTSWRMPSESAASARLRATSPTCMRRNSSKIKRRFAAVSSAIESGLWIARNARRAIDEVFPIQQFLVERVGEPAGRAPRQGVAHERAQLPCEHLGLARLRVHGHDHARLLVGAGATDHVDDRVRHLPLPAVHVELPEERGFGADGELLVAPRLVEEGDVEQRRAVGHDDFDERTALTRAPAVHALHFGEDRRLLPHLELGDVGLLRAVDPSARIVLQEVEHVLDVEVARGALRATRRHP